MSLRNKGENVNQVVEDIEMVENIEIGAEVAKSGQSTKKPQKKEVKLKDIRDIFRDPRHDNGKIRKTQRQDTIIVID